MGRRMSILVLGVLLLLVAPSGGERVNKSASLGRLLSTGMDEGDLLAWKKSDVHDLADKSIQDEEETHTDGGFSSLDGMLQWAIGNSDPEKLKEAALDIQELTPEDLMRRQLEIKELMEKLKMPSDAELMKISIADLNNLSLSFEDRHRALQELLVLVEPIDNANDLHKLGGLTALIRELDDKNPEIRAVAAWVLGKASQNNPSVQNQILELGALLRLMDMTYSNVTEEATKALYAVSALIRNNQKGQKLFYKQDGSMMLQFFLSHPSVDIRLLRKSVFLLGDLVESQLDARNDMQLPLFTDSNLLKSVVDLMSSEDLDLQEKAVYAVKNLLLLPYTDPVIFKEICKLDVALDKMKQQLLQFLLDDNLKEYAQDVQNLQTEVERLFSRKLEEGKSFLVA